MSKASPEWIRCIGGGDTFIRRDAIEAVWEQENSQHFNVETASGQIFTFEGSAAAFVSEALEGKGEQKNE